MRGLKGMKLVWAVLLALGLYQFVLLGLGISHWPRGEPGAAWSVVVWQRLQMLLEALPVAVAALVTGSLLRPARPERVAAVVGCVGGFGVLVLPHAWHIGYSPLAPGAYVVLSWFWLFSVALGVCCWVGANYWRSGSWRGFWRGPSGAIVKAGLVGGLVGLPLLLLGSWVCQQQSAEWYARAMHRPPPPFNWVGTAVLSLGGVTQAAVVAAILVLWRPKPALGVFAGAGIMVGLYPSLPSILALLDQQGQAVLREMGLVMPVLLGLSAAHRGAMGAVAGYFSGRWEEERGSDAPDE